MGNPAFFGRRLQHARFACGTVLAPSTAGDVSAGLAIFQSEKHFYYLGVQRTAEGVTVFLELANGGKPQRVAHATVPAADQIELRIKGDELSGEFLFRAAGAPWRSLVSDADLKPITTNAAGGGLHFTGAVVGVHARVEP